ncbi:hypothetical protein FB562_0291 [Homoserinimonas aerilata]|uniref:Uncharacterized protein n=1 Tax=Homoserinimonas aerilata TaxID=1162970 RepID=A0A542YGL6_9MICO|nr:hypothetical protein [Homoserinimonas aerilata]TQL47238.1 hypothetical protein FB562_0291 [Homoserinimonas aerilata]
MSDDSTPRELDEFEPFQPRPMRSRTRTWVLRTVVLLAVLALVLPGVITTISIAGSNAARACAYLVSIAEPSAHATEVHFEAFGPGGLGWECYAVDPFDADHHIASLGLIPVAPGMRQVPTSNS